MLHLAFLGPLLLFFGLCKMEPQSFSSVQALGKAASQELWGLGSYKGGWPGLGLSRGIWRECVEHWVGWTIAVTQQGVSYWFCAFCFASPPPPIFLANTGHHVV